MSRNLESLIAQAADMRAAGYTWAAVAQKVRRKVRTCQQWPRRHPFEWEFHYQAARQARFEQIAHEADTHLHKLMRSDDPKVQLKAVELSMRFGAAAYSGLSTVEMKTVYRVNQAAGRLPRTPAAGFGTRSTVDSTPTWQPTGCRRLLRAVDRRDEDRVPGQPGGRRDCRGRPLPVLERGPPSTRRRPGSQRAAAADR